MATKSNSKVLAQASIQRKKIEQHADYSEKQFQKDYKVIKVVGQGVWGIVSDVCRKRDGKKCKALKRVRINRTIEFQTADMDYQYLYFLRHMRLGKYDISPSPDRMWISGKGHDKTFYNLLMTKYAGNMSYLSIDVRREHILRSSLKHRFDVLTRGQRHTLGIYYRSELLRMYQIAWLIGQKGIIHGDLKPDQYLFNYGRTKHGRVTNIAVTDFGFAGLVSDVRQRENAKIRSVRKDDKQFSIRSKKFGLAEMGWPSNEKSPNSFGVCKSGLIVLDTRNEASLMNVAQLEAFLISDSDTTPTLIVDDKGRSLSIFVGVNGFVEQMKANPDIAEWFPKKFFSTYKAYKQAWKRRAHHHTIQFSWKQIQRK